MSALRMIADVRSPSPYSIAEGDSTERVRVLVLEGELDLAAAPRLQARLAETGSAGALVLDLSRATSSTRRCSRSCCRLARSWPSAT